MRKRYAEAVNRPSSTTRQIADDVFAGAIEFLADHPTVPTDEEIHEFYSGESEAGVSFDFLRRFAFWWGRRMFTDDQEHDPVEEVLD